MILVVAHSAQCLLTQLPVGPLASAANFRFPPISVIVGLSKTFNNHLGFERGFWQRQLGCFEIVPKTADCDTGETAVLAATWLRPETEHRTLSRT